MIMKKKKTAVLSDGKTAELTFDEAILAVELYSKELAKLTASVNKATSVIREYIDSNYGNEIE